MSMEKEKIVNEDVHRIRITLTSTNVKAVERGMNRAAVCLCSSVR